MIRESNSAAGACSRNCYWARGIENGGSDVLKDELGIIGVETVPQNERYLE